MISLQGRTAIISGANQGLGKAIATAYVKSGANLVICARNDALLRETEIELKALCCDTLPDVAQKGAVTTLPAVLAVKSDVSNRDDVATLVTKALDYFGRVDVVVNNAGIHGPIGELETIDIDEWISAIEVNLLGTMYVCHALLKHFKTNNYGKIINLSGGGATAPFPRFSAYAASKAAIVRLTETLAEETKDFQIDINAVAPGALNTRLLDNAINAGPEKIGDKEYERLLKQREEGGGSIDRAADLCVFLGSKESDGISGRLLSAVWDPWDTLTIHKEELKSSDIYTLRRIVPEDRNKAWSK